MQSSQSPQKQPHKSNEGKLRQCDLIKIPKILAKLHKCSELLLCTKISSNLHFLDVVNHQNVHIQKDQYLKYESGIKLYPLKNYGKQFQVKKSQIKKQPSDHKQVWNIKVKIPQQEKQIVVESLFNEKEGRKVIGYHLRNSLEFQQINDIPQIFIAKKTKSIDEPNPIKLKIVRKKSTIQNQELKKELAKKKALKNEADNKNSPQKELKLNSKESYPSYQEKNNSDNEDYDDQNYGDNYSDDKNQYQQFQWYEYNSDDGREDD